MNLPEKSDKQIIMNHIIRFMAQFRPGDNIRSEDIIKHVHRYHRRYIYGDTILRYARTLRSKGLISYRCTNKHDRIFQVV